ncbi:DUF3883 domain-containing protein [Campylobacter portucalensis]|nr:DUF3883 domain-containing protein [Campylobacter portucalensis]
MHSEAEIRKAIRPLLDKYGELNTSEIKQRLEEVLVYNEDDKVMSATRKEILILQRIGNIVAHQSELIKEYLEGFVVDKGSKPAKFIALEGIRSNKKPLSSDKIDKRKNSLRSFVGRKIDWSKKRERNTDVGNMGEEFVYEFEKERVLNFDSTSVSRVLHLSILQGDGLGYDVSSINEDGSTRRIEVKTTVGGLETPFYMSKNEKLFFETYKDDGAYVYRVYDFDVNTRRGKVEIISAEELLENYNFDPVTFAVTKK